MLSADAGAGHVRCGGLRTTAIEECGELGPGNAGGSVASHGDVPVPFPNGPVTVADGWEFARDAGAFYNSTRDLRDYWDGMVLNYWPLLTLMVNATADLDGDVRARGPGFARMSCIAPNGVGTGKAFSFSGVVPAGSTDSDSGNDRGSDANQDAGGGNDGATTDDKNSGVRLKGPASSALWAVLALPAVAGCLS